LLQMNNQVRKTQVTSPQGQEGGLAPLPKESKQEKAAGASLPS
jgi:hypothetical protein